MSHRSCERDRKSTRLNSSHVEISYAVFCLKKKQQNRRRVRIEHARAAAQQLREQRVEAECRQRGLADRLQLFFFFNDTAPTEIYPLPLHDALPIWAAEARRTRSYARPVATETRAGAPVSRSEEHTSELQSRRDLVCRLLLEKK